MTKRPATTFIRAGTLLVGAVCWLLLVGLILLQFWPNLPRSTTQWALVIVFGPPLYLLGELVFGWLFSDRHSRAISQSTFSFLRILVALPVLLVLVGLCWWLSSAI
jgi:hypothetical protein